MRRSIASARIAMERLEARALFAAGDLDATFGSGGVSILPDPMEPGQSFVEYPRDVAALPGGRLALAVDGIHRYWSPDDRDFISEHGYGIAFVEPGGGINAEMTSSYGGGAWIDALVARPAGDIVLAGGSLGDVMLVRYDRGQFLEPILTDLSAFAPAGVYSSSDAAVDAAVLPDGKLLVAGTFRVAFDGNARDPRDFARPFVLRYNPDLTLDRTFGGGDGVVFSDALPEAFATGMAVLPDGDIAVSATAQDATGGRFALYRFNGDGSVDTAFGGGDGAVTTDVGPGGDAASAVAITTGGKILVAGTAGFGGSATPPVITPDFVVVRYNPDGSPDPTFGGGDGIVVTNFRIDDEGVPTTDHARDLTVLADGRFVVAGSTSGSARGDDPDFAVTRYLPDGSLDPTFGPGGRDGDGKVSVNVGEGWDGGATSEDTGMVVAATPDGKVLVGGNNDGPRYGLSLARLLGDPMPPAGPQTYQAEDARLSGAVVKADHSRYTGTGYADYTNATGDYVEFTVNVPAAGRYALEFRYANGGTTDRPLIMSVNNSDGLAIVNFPPTGSWTTWRTAATQSPLNAGANTIRLIAAGRSGPNLDALTVRPVAATTVYEAEAATLSGPTVGRAHAGYTGAGYADFVRAAGDFIEWDVTAGESRQYVLEFRYANGSTLDRSLRLTVDGAVAQDRRSFAPTGSWSNWRTARVTVTLAAGTHKVRLTAIGRSGPNIDSLTVS